MIGARDLVGLACATSAALLAAAAWRAGERGRERAALAMILAVALVLRVFPATDPDLHEWDESYHALVAKHLAVHPGTPTLYDDPVLPYDKTAWTRNHVWLHKQPFALWTIAGSLSIFGASPFAVRLPSILASIAGVAMTAAIGRALGGPRVAFLAAALHAVHGPAITYAAGRAPTDHVDAMFAVLVEAAVYFAVIGRARAGLLAPVAVGGAIGLAALTKSPAALAALPVFAVLRASSFSWRVAAGDCALALGVAAAVFAPWQWHSARKWPVEAAHERAYDFLHVTRALEGHGGGPFFHLGRIPRYFGEFAPLSIVWFVVTARRPLERAALVWFALPYAFFSLVATKMPGYVLMAAPAVFLMIARHADVLLETARSSAGLRRAAAYALAAILLLLPARAGLERMKPVGSAPWPSFAVRELHAAARSHADVPIVAFNMPDPIRAMFHTPFIAYEKLPDDADFEACRARGRRVLLWDNGRLPPALRDRPDVLLWPAR